ncbi:MAG: phosphotransferase [Clostridia bacterium]|nr:phosphotransferase [Clostridia bacterium]
MNRIIQKAINMGFDCNRAELIREKDGVTVARLYDNDSTAILKWFAPGISTREVTNYSILASLGVPTLRVIASCTDAIIIEDMAAASCPFRLAEEKDMSDEDIARNLAKWYRKLHTSGFSYVQQHGEDMYSEASLFTPENIAKIKRDTGLRDLPLWRLIDENYGIIAAHIAAAPMTLTYNDFYYTNMAVARDGTAAMMFDYNLLGKGHVYSDMRNVEYSLSPAAAAAFRAAYGEYDFSHEAAIDAVISPIITLHFAYARAEFPDWALPELKNLQNGYKYAVEALLEHEIIPGGAYGTAVRP